MNKTPFRNAGGSVLISAAVAAGILAILVAGFVSYMTNEYMLNYHTHAWTQSLHLAEGGIEKGFAEFNYQYFQGSNGFQSSRGWINAGGGTYSNSLVLTNSLGKVVGTAGVIVNGVGTTTPSVQGTGTATVNRGPATVSRSVKVILAKSPPFPAGLVSKSTINLNGNNMYSDSFDSTDVTKSNNGSYIASKKQPNGNIASDSVIVDSVGVGNADIYGTVATGPAGSITIGPNGSVGNTFVNANRASDVTTGITDGYIRSDFNFVIPDVTLPSDAGSWISKGSINNNTTLGTGDYQASSISLAGSKTLTINGTVRLYVTGDTSTTGNGSISISAGASLTVYFAGNANLAGNGVVNNATTPIKNQWFGLPSATSVSIAGNGAWIGTIYAPSAAMSVSGNGDLSGAAVANSLTLGGNANFHYDESLKTLGGSVGYLVVSWQELRYSGGSWVP